MRLQLQLDFNKSYRDFFHGRSLKSLLDQHIGWSYKVLLMCYMCQKDCLSCTKAAQTRAYHQEMKPVMGPVGDELWRAVEDLVLLWGLCVLALSFLENCVKGYGWPHCLAILVRVAQPKPWLTLARQEPWHSSGGEMAQISSWIPWTYRCRGLRIASLRWNDVLKPLEQSNVPVHPTLKKACKQWGRTYTWIRWPQGSPGRQHPLCSSFQAVTCGA